MQAACNPNSLLLALRAGTGMLHAEVQSSCRVAEYVISEQGYVEVLSRLMPLYRALEADLWASTDSWRPAPWADRISHDLAKLQVPDVSPSVSLPYISPVHSESSRLGRLYVLEGGTLGGHALARTLWDEHRYHAANGASFYAAPDSGLRWKAFQAYLTKAEPWVNFDEAVQSAIDTFEVLRQFSQSAFPALSR